jgi:hypothetical protein
MLFFIARHDRFSDPPSVLSIKYRDLIFKKIDTVACALHTLSPPSAAAVNNARNFSFCSKWTNNVASRKLMKHDDMDIIHSPLFDLRQTMDNVRTGNTLRLRYRAQRLMLCKICGFQGDDYEECRLLGYKKSQFVSHRKHCVSTTKPSLLMLCEI